MHEAGGREGCAHAAERGGGGGTGHRLDRMEARDETPFCEGFFLQKRTAYPRPARPGQREPARRLGLCGDRVRRAFGGTVWDGMGGWLVTRLNSRRLVQCIDILPLRA